MKTKKKSKDDLIVLALESRYGLTPTREHRFHETRRWRFDFAFPDLKVALEKEGGVFMGGAGRHTSGAGFTKDCEKYSVAAGLGWLVIRATTTQINKWAFLPWLDAAIELRQNGGPL